MSENLRVVVLLVGGSLASGCDGRADPTPAEPRRWSCPPTWVPRVRGGCGPAVILCAPDGGAAPGVCTALTQEPSSSTADGDRGFRRHPDGAVSVGTMSPGTAGGPPDEGWRPATGQGVPEASFAPEAGVPYCLPGWTRRPEGGCTPTLRADCSPGASPLPDGTCTPTGAADCPGGAYPDPPPGVDPDRVLHVRAGASPSDADGSILHPYPSLRTALENAAVNAWVVVAAGDYSDTLVIDRSVHVVGRCAASVRLAGGVANSAPTIEIRGARTAVDLRGLTLSGSGQGLHVFDAARVTVSGVTINAATHHGLYVQGERTRVEARGVRIVATSPRLDMQGGEGVVVDSGGTLVGSGLSLERNGEFGVVAFGQGAALELSNSVVDDTRPRRTDGSRGAGVMAISGSDALLRGLAVRGGKHGVIANTASVTIEDSTIAGVTGDDAPTGGFGGGLQSLSGGSLSATRTTLLRCGVAGASVAGASATGAVATLELSTSLIEDPIPSPAGRQGLGVSVLQSGEATVSRTVLRGGRVAGAVSGESARLVLNDSRALNALTARPAEVVGSGVFVDGQGYAELNRVRVEGRGGTGVAVTGAGSTLLARHVFVTSTREVSGGAGGAVSAVDGAELTLEHALVADNVGIGIFLRVASAVINEAVVRDTAPLRNGTSGDAVRVQGGRLTAQGLRLEGNHLAGVSATNDAEVTLTRGVVSGLLPGSSLGLGAGLLAGLGGRIEATACHLEGNTGDAVHAEDPGSSVTLMDSVVQGTLPSREQAGAGLSGIDGGSVVARRVLLARNRGTGVSTEDGGEVRLFDSTVSTTLIDDGPNSRGIGIAVNVQAGGFAEVVGCEILDNLSAGVFASGAGARARVSRTFIAHTRERLRGTQSSFGSGLLAANGGLIDAFDTYLADNQMVAALAIGSGTRMNLHNVLIEDVVPSGLRGSEGAFGGGVLSMLSADLTVDRLAVVRARGAAAGASPIATMPGAPPDHARLTGGDVFVLDTRPSVIGGAEGGERAVAYGIHAGTGCVTDLARVVIEGGQWGLFAAGELSVRQGVITRQTEAAGARRSVTTSVTLTEVERSSNLDDQIVVEPSLPEVSLQPPEAPCFRPPCGDGS